MANTPKEELMNSAIASLALELCQIPDRKTLSTKEAIENQIENKYNSQFYDRIVFSNGVARGPRELIHAVIDTYQPTNAIVNSTEIPGILELNMRNSFSYDGSLPLLEIITHFPTLKVAGFLATKGYVYIAYSESGYAGITDMQYINEHDRKSEYPWDEEYSPTEKINTTYIDIPTNDRVRINYRFPHEKSWFDRNYFLPRNGKIYRIKLSGDVLALPWDSPQLWKLKRSTMQINEAYIVAYLGNEKEIFFPEKINNLDIRGIAKRTLSAPQNYKDIEILHFPETYKEIGENAFHGCSALLKIAKLIIIEESSYGKLL